MGKAVVVALCLYAALCGGLYVTAIRATGSHYVYSQDDTYIQMAMARNWAEHGVFGVTRYEYSSSSSVPMWTLVTAVGFRLLGPAELLPAALSFSCGVLLLCLCGYLLQLAQAPAAIRSAALIGIVLATPLPYLALGGMEPLFHAILIVAIVYLAGSILAAGPGQSSKRVLSLTCFLIA